MSNETMKAVRIHAFGGQEVLQYEDAPKPVLQPGEVLVRVHAVGINPPDCGTCATATGRFLRNGGHRWTFQSF